MTSHVALSPRNSSIVQLIARFGQAKSDQTFFLLFPDATSKTPCTRALRWLTERDYLAVTGRPGRYIGGRNSGSAPYVYQLGPVGHELYETGRYRPDRNVRDHSLVIVDAFSEIVRRQRAGEFEIVGYSTERHGDCWVKIGRYDLQPDLFVELARDGLRRRLWLEIDMATQAHGQIKAKFQRYWDAYGVADHVLWPEYQGVLFVGIDEARAAELKWLLGQMPGDVQAFIDIISLPELSTASL